MAVRSLVAVLSAIASLASAEPQISALPAVTGPASDTCGGCYVVADVAGILFGGVQTQTQTNVVSIGQGRNGSQTTTQVLQNSQQVTFVSGGPATAGIATSFNPLSSVITVGGATLTSPTSYEVFSAYSVTRTVSGPNGCSVSSGSAVSLDVASSYAIPENAGTDYLLIAESSFISAIGFPSCSAGGGQVQSTIHSMLTTTTQHITTTGLIRPTPVAASTIASATATAGSAPSGVAASSAVVILPNGTLPSATAGATFTIIPAINAAPKAAPAWSSWTSALVCGAALIWWL